MRHACAAAIVAIILGFGPCLAQPLTTPGASPELPGAPETSDQPAQQDRSPSISTSLPPGLADPGGVRASLEEAGIVYSLTYIGEGLSNARGGVRRGTTFQGRADFQLDADLGKLAGLPGLVFHTNVYGIHNRGLSTCCLRNLFVASGIEATPAVRLFELWLEQKAFDGKLSVRAGQLSADTEFLVSQFGGLFVNATFGWPGITAANLPNGGPAYPTATPGVRVKLSPTDQLSLLAAVFNGDPVGQSGDKDPQRRDRSGLEFRASDPALVIAEAAYSYAAGRDSVGLPGTIKLGGWRHFGRFDDRRFGDDGLSLADPLGSGIARRLRGNEGLYAVLDQVLYRVPGTADQGIGLFARLSGSPSDRNLISFYADGGLTFKGLIPGRPDDTFGIGAGYAQISGRARGFDRDVGRFGAIAALGEFDPETGTYPNEVAATRALVRSSEALLEVTYQAQIVPGFTLQPDFQYVVRPGANVANPRAQEVTPVKNAAIFGLRATIRY